MIFVKCYFFNIFIEMNQALKKYNNKKNSDIPATHQTKLIS